jgi:glutathione S-transferase
MPLSETPERTLYQFPVSHYCEKTRWCLDAKGLPYAVRNLLPGLHVVVTRRVAGHSMVPVLLDRGTAVADSTAIALHLEGAYPEPALLPQDPAARARVLDLAAYFDRQAGGAVRRWVYGQLLSVPGAVAGAFFYDYPPRLRAFGRLVSPLLERALRRRYRIAPDTIERARTRSLEALERLEHEIDGDPSRYLVGDALTLADITAASLFGPLLQPPGSPWDRPFNAPASLLEAREMLRRRPGGQWILQRYQYDRERRALA